MDLLCSEPSPTSPTEKFFDSEQKQLPTTTNSNSNEMNGGKMDNSNTNGSPESDSISVSVGHKMGSNGLESNRYDLCSSPLSEASSGYGSTLAQSSPEVDDVDMCNFLQIGDDSSHGEMPTRASHDAHMLNDLRIPRQMLQIECQYVPFGVVEGVYLNGKYEADERARTIVTEWMLEVCEELKCEEVTFPLAVNYLDRFLLASPEIRKYQLQLIAVVCLLIASKIRQCQAINPYDLSYMTDNSVEVEQILNWELLVLKRLQWDVSSILAIDYLDHILVNLPELVQNSYDRQHNGRSHHNHYTSSCLTVWPSQYCTANDITDHHHHHHNQRHHSHHNRQHQCMTSSNKRSMGDETEVSSAKRFKTVEHRQSSVTDIQQTIRRHASTLISLCSTELQFVCVQPSVIAAACVATAVRGIFHQSKHSPSISSTLATYSQQLQIEIDSEYIEHYVNRIETLFAHRTAKLVATEGSNSKVDDTKLITNSSSCSTSSTSSTSVNNIVISSSCSTASSDIKSTNEGSTESVSHYHPHTAAHHTHHNHRSHSHHQHHHHHHHHHHNSSARAHSHQSHPLMMSQQSGQQSSSYYASKHNHSTQMHSSLHSNNNKSNHNSVSSMGKGTIISVPASTTTTSTMSTINSRNRGNINTTSVPSSSDLFMFDESIHTVGSYSFAQVASAKQLLLESQSNRVPQSYRHCSTNRSYHIPVCSRSAHPPVNHLHDASNTSAAISSSASSNIGGGGGGGGSNNTLKQHKLYTLNQSASMVLTNPLITYPPELRTNNTYQNDENRENIPVFIMNVDNANATNTNVANSNTNDLELLTTSEELPDDDDDELL